MKKRKNAPMWAKHLKRKFEIEKNAKNKAYHFIFSMGLGSEFYEYCKNHHSENPHVDCLNELFKLKSNA